MEYPVNHFVRACIYVYRYTVFVLISVIKCDLKYTENGIFGIDNNYRGGAYKRTCSGEHI